MTFFLNLSLPKVDGRLTLISRTEHGQVERRSMPRKHSILTSGLLATGLAFSLFSPATADPKTPHDGVAVQGARDFQRPLSSISSPYARAKAAAAMAQSIEASIAADAASAAQSASRIDSAIEALYPKLNLLGRTQSVHGHEEPLWVTDSGATTSQALLALCALERWKPDAQRLQTIKALGQGLMGLQRPDKSDYPFGAHLSWKDGSHRAQVGSNLRVPSVYFEAGKSNSVGALAEAAKLLGDKAMLASAQRAALGMTTHLIIGGRYLESFSPQPKYSRDSRVALQPLQGLTSLYRSTGQEIYSQLAALGLASLGGQGSEFDALRREIGATSSAPLLKARPVGQPNSSQIVEAENGKVVNKAIDSVDFKTPAGDAGKLVSMGRDNTFWMRFDVPTEDDYLFYLTYLQSDVGGALVSVMMRIDGDKIFQVPLGDVDGRAIMRRKYVDGPRPLRSGPHSFGIRFSGLLMTKPALLDSVIVQPAIERREFQLPTGEKLYLLRNVTDEVAKTDRKHFASWPPAEATVVNGEGQVSKLGAAEDRRRRKNFVTLPPHGVAILKINPGAPRLE